MHVNVARGLGCAVGSGVGFRRAGVGASTYIYDETSVLQDQPLVLKPCLRHDNISKKNSDRARRGVSYIEITNKKGAAQPLSQSQSQSQSQPQQQSQSQLQ